MKSYEFIKTYTLHGKERTIKLVTSPDPKREGLYKTTEVQVNFNLDGKNNNFSYLYGKCNQSEIQQLIAKSTEI